MSRPVHKKKNKRSVAFNKSLPEDLIDPISFKPFEDPVVTADGESYERTSIESWFATGKITSPLTNQKLATQALTPNKALRRAVQSVNQRQNADFDIICRLQNDKIVLQRRIDELEKHLVSQLLIRSQAAHVQRLVQERAVQRQGRPAKHPYPVADISRHARLHVLPSRTVVEGLSVSDPNAESEPRARAGVSIDDANCPDNATESIADNTLMSVSNSRQGPTIAHPTGVSYSEAAVGTSTGRLSRADRQFLTRRTPQQLGTGGRRVWWRSQSTSQLSHSLPDAAAERSSPRSPQEVGLYRWRRNDVVRRRSSSHSATTGPGNHSSVAEQRPTRRHHSLSSISRRGRQAQNSPSSTQASDRESVVTRDGQRPENVSTVEAVTTPQETTQSTTVENRETLGRSCMYCGAAVARSWLSACPRICCASRRRSSGGGARRNGRPRDEGAVEPVSRRRPTVTTI